MLALEEVWLGAWSYELYTIPEGFFLVKLEVAVVVEELAELEERVILWMFGELMFWAIDAIGECPSCYAQSRDEKRR